MIKLLLILFLIKLFAQRDIYKCRCESKELIDKEICDKWFIWNPSTCECDKSCDFGEYLDYENCKFRKTLIDKLVENVMKILMRRNYIQVKWFIIQL